MIGIYKITNLINNKVYIGQSNDIYQRWLAHKRINEQTNSSAKIKQQYPLYQAFKKYGLNNFSFEVIEECSIQKLDEREIFWIKYYNSYIDFQNSCGYNLTTGGSGNQKISEEQITKIIQLWNDGKSTGEIMNETNIERHSIIKYLKLFSSYTIEEGEKRGRINNGLSHQKAINQYNLMGNFIKQYPNIIQASKELNISESSLQKNLNYRSKKCQNFYFIYADEDQKEGLLKHKRKCGNTRMIAQIDNNNIIINVFSSIAEASRFLGKENNNNISMCCAGKTQSAYGYHWKYLE